MKKIFAFLCLFFIFINACFCQNIKIPAGYTVIQEKEGDLDKDGIAEKVIVYNTSETGNAGTIREIRIFKKSKSEWVLFKSSKKAVRESEDGGMMADPFQSIGIKNGILLIEHAGGSSWKWDYTDKYRFQNNEFELIGHTSNFGKLCEYWSTIDFNLSTGGIIYKKEIDACEKEEPTTEKPESETFYKKGLHLNLSNRHLKEIKIVSPKYKYELYM